MINLRLKLVSQTTSAASDTMIAGFGYRRTREASGKAQFHSFSALLSVDGGIFLSDPIINVEGVQFGIKLKPHSVNAQTGRVSMKLAVVRLDQLEQAVRAFSKVEIGPLKFQSTSVRTFSIDHEWGWSDLEAGAAENYASKQACINAYPSRLQAYIDKGWVVDDTLTVKVFMRVFIGEPGSMKTNMQPQGDGLQCLSSDLQQLLQGTVACDITLECEDGQQGAHRTILAARSPVFRTMLEQPMQESQKGIVSMSDVDLACMRLFLTYIYCGTVAADIDDKGLWALTSLAHKYDVQGLLLECTRRWQAKLEAGSVARLLQEADKLGIADLKQSAIEFITHDRLTFEEVQDSEDFKQLPPALLQEVISHLMGARKRPRVSDSHEVPDDSEWESLSVARLKQALRERGLPTTGNKIDLITRLQSLRR